MSIVDGQTITAADVGRLMKTFSLTYLGNSGTTVHNQVDTPNSWVMSDGGTNLLVHNAGAPVQKYDVTADWAAVDFIFGIVMKGDYVYALLRDTAMSGPLRMYRYSKTNIAAGGTLCTFSGQTQGTTVDGNYFAADPTGVYFYFTCKAGNSASQHIISKYSLSGTTFTYIGDITCGSTSANAASIFHVDASGNIFLVHDSDKKIRKYNSSGTLQATSIAFSGNMGSYVIGDSTIGQKTYIHSSSGFWTEIDLPS